MCHWHNMVRGKLEELTLGDVNLCLWSEREHHLLEGSQRLTLLLLALVACRGSVRLHELGDPLWDWDGCAYYRAPVSCHGFSDEHLWVAFSLVCYNRVFFLKLFVANRAGELVGGFCIMLLHVPV